MEEMNNWIGPIVKQVWNIAIHVLDIFSFVKNTIATTWADTAFISFY